MENGDIVYGYDTPFFKVKGMYYDGHLVRNGIATKYAHYELVKRGKEWHQKEKRKQTTSR
jgi:hypothetical protein